MRALAMSLGLLVVELIAGVAGNSVALLADAGHVFADVTGLGLSAFAIWLAERPAGSGRSYGLYRLEILAAGANATLLLGLSAVLIIEGSLRVAHPEAPTSTLMILVAAGALVVNLVAARLLGHGQRASLNVRAAYLEVLGDAAGAATVLISGILIAISGLAALDVVAAVVIGLLIIPRTWGLLRDVADVLLEATPKGVRIEEVRRHILESPGVAAVHDLHIWTITSGMNVVSAHVVLEDDADPGRLIDHLSDCLAGDFDIDHSTFQLETPEHVRWEGRAARTQH